MLHDPYAQKYFSRSLASSQEEQQSLDLSKNFDHMYLSSRDRLENEISSSKYKQLTAATASISATLPKARYAVRRHQYEVASV
jgi:hypothetical protein